MTIELNSIKHGSATVFLDDADYEKIKQYTWTLWKGPKKNIFYARSHNPENHNETIWMHRLIMDCKNGEIIDHIDRNWLNNCKSNLRGCTTRQNKLNSKTRKDSKTGVKGIKRTKSGTFHARITIKPGERLHLGTFSTAEEAHKAYCAAVKKYHGEFGRTA